MGHYRSEMVSDQEHAEEVSEREKKIQSFEINIQKAIDERGVARVLAEMCEDFTVFRIHNRWTRDD